MSTVVNKSDPSIFRESADTGLFPTADWLINPAGFLTLFGTVEPKYWKLTGAGTDIEEMTAGEKTTVDADLATALTTSVHDGLTDEVDTALPSGVAERAEIQGRNKRDNYLVNRLIELQDRVQAMLDSTGGVANMRADGLAVSISATANRPLSDAISDYKADIDTGVADG